MNKILFIVKNVIKIVLRLFFSVTNNGNECLVCGSKSFIYPVCKKCIKKYFNINNVLNTRRCKFCGKELLSEEEICMQCRKDRIVNNVDKLIPLFSYRLWNKELMFYWKSMEIRSLSFLFAKMICEALKKMDISVIVPVPPRPNKIQMKGWDQIQEMSSFLEYVFGFKVLNLLERKTEIQQKKLDRKERLETIGMSYCLKDKKSLDANLKCVGGILPEKVCIIDDVCTTGSTIESCSQLLKKTGIKSVYAVTLFIVD